VNWLEVGCPFCPSVLTLPRIAAGRTIRCPECEKSYLVPTPVAAAENAPAHSVEPASSIGVESSPEAVNRAAIELEPTKEFTPMPASVKESPGPEPAESRYSASPAAKVASPRRSADVEVNPAVAESSPLPQIPILSSPPEVGKRPAAAPPPPAATPKPSRLPERLEEPAEPSQAEPTASLHGPTPPLGPPAPTGRETAEEAQRRIHRAELRTRVNLAIFVIGTIVMIGFAWIVIRFSKS
jgi:hypothetical protein